MKTTIFFVLFPDDAVVFFAAGPLADLLIGFPMPLRLLNLPI